MKESRPIGVFDSSLGGLTVVHQLREQLPNEQIIYIGDTLRCPYGGRSKEAIKNFSKELTEFLLKQNVKMIVVACNTVSAVALDDIKEVAGDIPVLGVVEPGCKAAVTHSEDKKVGVIGTRATIGAGAYGNGIRELQSDIKVFESACPLLVPMVEEGFSQHPVVDMVLEEYLDDLIDFGIDTLVLGCTHYPLLINSIRRVVGGRIEVIDSAWWTAREVGHILKELDLLTEKRIGEDHFYTTDMTDEFQRLAATFLQGDMDRLIEVVL